MNTIYVYCIRCTKNNKVYVGATKHPSKRWTMHKWWPKYGKNFESQSACKLYTDMQKYGLAKFVFSIVEECSMLLASEREVYWIRKLDSIKHGYNIVLGGYLEYKNRYSNKNRKFGRKGQRNTVQMNQRISKALKGVKKTEEHKQKLKEGIAKWRAKRKAYAKKLGKKLYRV